MIDLSNSTDDSSRDAETTGDASFDKFMSWLSKPDDRIERAFRRQTRWMMLGWAILMIVTFGLYLFRKR